MLGSWKGRPQNWAQQVGKLENPSLCVCVCVCVFSLPKIAGLFWKTVPFTCKDRKCKRMGGSMCMHVSSSILAYTYLSVPFFVAARALKSADAWTTGFDIQVSFGRGVLLESSLEGPSMCFPSQLVRTRTCLCEDPEMAGKQEELPRGFAQLPKPGSCFELPAAESTLILRGWAGCLN